ncbi:Aste57867_10010 [Aphanomyces stellatus]|uniref:Aste57867_10010 protein n=1 Tax=Aphanomyces stellatus TaxID=120398 RepID=A0A485KPR7_9STRA|nr:hypothetical protein As57867_009971 [Aphanomyces stellatus]VFT86888.1 Aste57867_10010 [Aphanomyces stellatus]
MFNQSPPICGTPLEWRRVVACGLAFAAIIVSLTLLTASTRSISVVLGMLLAFFGLTVAFAGMHMPRTVVASSMLLLFSFFVSPSLDQPILLLVLSLFSVAITAFATLSSGHDTLKAFFVGAVAPMCLADIVLMLIYHTPSLLDIDGRQMRTGRNGWFQPTSMDMAIRLVVGAALGLVVGIVTMRFTTKSYFPNILVGLTSCTGAFMLATSLILTAGRSKFDQEVIFVIGWAVAALVQLLYKPPTHEVMIFVVQEVVPTTTMASETHSAFDKLPC